jgi:hypothetical protein
MHLVTLAPDRIDPLRNAILFRCAFCGWTGSVNPSTGRARGIDGQHSIVYGPDLLAPHEWTSLGVRPMPGIELDLGGRTGIVIKPEREKWLRKVWRWMWGIGRMEASSE